MKPEIRISDDSRRLIIDAAAYVSDLIHAVLKVKNDCTLVLSGGSTPRELYAALASQPYVDSLPWDRVHLFWGDERTVPPEHEDSNYRMAREAMIDRLGIPEDNVHRIPAEMEPEAAASAYESVLKTFFKGGPFAPGRDGVVPVFDLVLLGLGEDGHTASLFPETTVLEERRRWVSSVYVPRLDTHRITLTYPVINNAATVLFLVSGASKSRVLGKLFDGTGSVYPAAKVSPHSGKLVFLTDITAAADL
jgi:6-phosphogluconolactonase